MNDNWWFTEAFESDLAKTYSLDHFESDRRTFRFEMYVHFAHVEMLFHEHIINREEASQLLAALLRVWNEGPGIVPLREGRVEFFSNLEDWLVDEIGIDTGGKFHIGRSRNDIECTIARMMSKEYLTEFAFSVIGLTRDLLAKASEHVETVMPGYTHHSQHAQPTTLGHYLLWGVDSYMRDLGRASDCFDRTDRCSMGAAALCTTGFPINRDYTARLLGFKDIAEHSVDAAGSRDHLLEAASVLAIFESSLNRLTELLLIWNIREIGMVRLAKKHCSYSSIMPQKVNPIGIEMVRTSASDTYSRLLNMLITLKATTPGNGREPGHVDSCIFDMYQSVIPAAAYTGEMVRMMEVNRAQCLKLAKEGFSTMTELADMMVREKNISFYMAHHIVSSVASAITASGLELKDINSSLLDETAMKLYHRTVGLSDSDIHKALDPVENVRTRSITGGPSFDETRRMIEARLEKIKQTESLWQSRKNHMEKAAEECLCLAQKICGIS